MKKLMQLRGSKILSKTEQQTIYGGSVTQCPFHICLIYNTLPLRPACRCDV